jgi:hypothetical protein
MAQSASTSSSLSGHVTVQAPAKPSALVNPILQQHTLGIGLHKAH